MSDAPTSTAGLLKRRPRQLRFLGALLLPVVAVVAPVAGRPEWLHELFESVGIMLLVACLVGRGWASVYVAGRKNQELVTAGPYSVVRNPLYVFSFLGVVGVTLISEMLSLLAVAVIAFALYHRAVVRREEVLLESLYGTAFDEYRRRVPRWFPNLAGWRDVPKLEVQPRLIVHHLRDSGLFFLAYVFFEVCEYVREVGLFSPLLFVP